MLPPASVPSIGDTSGGGRTKVKAKTACIFGDAPSACRYKEPDASPASPDEVTLTSIVCKLSLPDTCLTPSTCAEPQEDILIINSLKLLMEGKLRTENWTPIATSLTAGPWAGAISATIGAVAGMYWNCTAEHFVSSHTDNNHIPDPFGPSGLVAGVLTIINAEEHDL